MGLAAVQRGYRGGARRLGCGGSGGNGGDKGGGVLGVGGDDPTDVDARTNIKPWTPSGICLAASQRARLALRLTICLFLLRLSHHLIFPGAIDGDRMRAAM